MRALDPRRHAVVDARCSTSRDRVSQDGGERGLLGIAFSPDGTQLYLDSTDNDGNTQIDQFTMQGRNADPSSRRTILDRRPAAAQPQRRPTRVRARRLPLHRRSATAARGRQRPGHAPGGNGQSLDTLLGKILRIAPNPNPGGAPYTVPADNPFVGATARGPEIWAYGLRNPWRFSFDRDTGDLWIGDVGQNEFEEIDHVAATNGRDAGKGANFGWNRLEGDARPTAATRPTSVVAPVYEISHDTGACSVTGGFVYRGKVIPSLVGSYLFSDTCDCRGPRARPRRPTAASPWRTPASPRSRCRRFGQADDGDPLRGCRSADGIFRVDAG